MATEKQIKYWNSLKGKSTWNKGLKYSEEQRKVYKKYWNSLKEHIPWNKGLTKETDKRLKNISEMNKGKKLSKKTKEKISINLKNKFKNNLINPPGGWNKGLTKEDNKSIKTVSEKMLLSYKNGKKVWSTGLTKNTDKRLKQTSIRMKELNKGKKLSEKHKNKIRKSAINYLKDVRHILWPCIGRHETKILENMENIFNYKIERQYQCEGYFVDGYCVPLNLAIEIDEKHHRNQLEKDKMRQQIIEQKLGCKFLRIEV